MLSLSTLLHPILPANSRQIFQDPRKLQKNTSAYKPHILVLRFLVLSTPGKYVLCLLAVISCLAISMIALSYTITAKRTTYERILDHSIDLDTTARVLYTSLSNLDEKIVDLSINDYPDQHLIVHLRDDLTQVTRAVVFIAENSTINDQQYVHDLQTINTHLPDYIQQLDSFLEPHGQSTDMEKAWSQNAYISDMYLLPAAKDLLNKNILELIKESSQATNIPFFLIFLIIVALLSLGWTFWLFASKSGRKNNLGILIALNLTFLQFVWIFGAGFVGSIFGNQARDLGVSDLSHQTSILIHAEQARRNELLKISPPQHPNKFNTPNRNFFLNLNEINQDIINYSPHTQTGEVFLVNVNHLIYHWSHIATAFSRFSAPVTVANSERNSMTTFSTSPRHNPLISESLSEVILTSHVWNTLKYEIDDALESTTHSYALAAQESFEIWRDAVLATFVFGGISIISASLGIILRLRDFRR